MAHKFSTSYIEDSLSLFRYYKKLGEGAMEQVGDEQLFAALDPEMNSIAIMVKHIAGNMRSRWTDFLTSDGEKPDRNRDGEFEPHGPSTREQLMKMWDEGFGVLFAAVEALTPDDLEKTITIRNQPMTVVVALDRSVTHLAYHVGQIVFLARQFAFASGHWTSLTIPKGKSAGLNKRM